ncbi:hypothetical protein ACH518_12030 [Methylomonas sp. HW2-6]|uniref:hypothetical protein n=1 Tax=Methylomonas sp. HW2-6 TaxID=3376687 RepID=UPI004041BFA5
MKIAFWNIKNKNHTILIKNLMSLYNIDILGLAESSNIDDNIMLIDGFKCLHRNGKIKVFTRVGKSIIKTTSESDRYIFIEFKSPSEGVFLICFCHLVDRINFKTDLSRGAEIHNFKDEILRQEKLKNTKNTIIFGDLNINPFETPMTGAFYLNATIDSKIASKLKRTLQKKEYEYLYNPMWKFFSKKERPYGTYYLNNPCHEEHHWNILDNVLLRPQIINKLVEDSLIIMTNIGANELLSRNGLINSKYSDHLPILAEFNI